MLGGGLKILERLWWGTAQKKLLNIGLEKPKTLSS